MVHYLDEFDLPVQNYDRKDDFVGASFMTSFPANAPRKSKGTQAHFVEHTVKYQNKLSKQGLLNVVSGP